MKDIVDLIKNKKYHRIILWGISIGVLTVAAALYELNSSYHLEIDRAVIQSDNLSQVLEQQLSILFNKFDMSLSETLRDIESKGIKNFNQKDLIKSILEEHSKDLPEARTFFIAGKDGRDLFRMKDGKYIYFGDREYFIHQKESSEDRLYISRPFTGRISNVASISFSRKFLDKNRKFNGIVSVTVPLSFFRNIFSSLDVGKEGVISLGSNENILYARYPWDEKNIGIVPDSKLDGIVRYSSFHRVGESNLFVHVGISKNEVLASWKRRCLFYFVGFVIFWIGGAVSLFRFLKSLQELDERKKLAVQNAKLASLGEMASGIAHEINNPLAVIHSRALHLRRQIDRGQYDPDNFKESLQKINLTVDRIAKIIRGLKSFSRNADQDELVPTNLKSIVDNTLELCNEKFRNQLVLLKIDQVPDVKMACRESQMVQVLLNLLYNAYDAVEEKEERWIHMSFMMKNKNTITIRITDSGTGIPEKIAQNIMQPFFTTKDVGKGTGLGLSISKGIIEDHSGEIYLDRKSDNTCFVLNLPVLQVNSEAVKQAG